MDIHEFTLMDPNCWWQTACTRSNWDTFRARQYFEWTPTAHWIAPAQVFRYTFEIFYATEAENSSTSKDEIFPNSWPLVVVRRISSMNAFRLSPCYVCRSRRYMPGSPLKIVYRPCCGTTTMWMAANNPIDPLLHPHCPRSLLHSLKQWSHKRNE